MRRVTVHRSQITGNLANDDGGGVYARRGGVRVYDSVISTNLVDGSGGAIGSTGDILVVRSQVSGNTTDGDRGALYTDEDGDVTVIGSVIDGNDADGPGGAIFTLDGDVALLDTTLIGNRADDRGGAVSGEADVLVVNSTIARNLRRRPTPAVASGRGGHGPGQRDRDRQLRRGPRRGGILSAGRTWCCPRPSAPTSPPSRRTSLVLRATNSIIGPAQTDATTGDARPDPPELPRRQDRVGGTQLRHRHDLRPRACGRHHGRGSAAAPARGRPSGLRLTPFDGSPVRGRIPPRRPACRHRPARFPPVSCLSPS